MNRLREYLAHAETCRSMAAKAMDINRKAELLELAANWSILADERGRLLGSQRRLAELP